MQQAYDDLDLSIPETAREKLFGQVKAELLGYGPIQPLLEDSSISEIRVYGSGQVYVERNGELQDTNLRFEDDEHVY